jgi:hypothetical protein
MIVKENHKPSKEYFVMCRENETFAPVAFKAILLNRLGDPGLLAANSRFPHGAGI